MIPKGTWVQIHRIVLPAGNRADNLPEDTKKVPFEMWDKGFLMADSELGADVAVVTASGRTELGTLIGVHPCYLHNYGQFVPEILEIDRIVKKAFYGEKR